MSPRLLLSIAALVAVVLFAWREFDATSPGDLSGPHFEHPDLQGSEGCAECHGQGGFATSCSSCHSEIGEQLAEGQGFHGTLARVQGRAATGEVQASSCGSCHRDHHGRELRLVGDMSWRLAGLASPQAFDHAVLDYALEGVHAELDCAACHANADAEHLAAGERRFLGLEASCASCHDDAHEGRIERGCAECHGQRHDFRTLDGFEHGAAFELTGPHALETVEARSWKADFLATTALAFEPHADALPGQVARADACLVCHAPGSPTSVEAIADHPPAIERACADCHTDPHESAFGRDCTACHSPTSEWRDLADFRHDTFALTGVHGRSSCTACHAEASAHSVDALTARARSASANPVRACADCHASPHTPGFLEASTNALASGAWSRTPGLDALAQAPPPPGVADCAACHGDDAQLANVELGFRIPAERAGEWLPAAFHDATAMPLVAPHANRDCASCHAGPATRVEFDFTGRKWRAAAPTVASAGPASFEARYHTDAARTPSDCTTCHSDPHAGEFAGRSEPQALDCTSCHAPTTFRPHFYDVVRHALSAFPLEGSHQAVTCRECHTERITEGPASGLMRFADTPKACEACHANLHAEAELSDLARLDLSGEAPRVVPADAAAPGCAQCHTTTSFATLTAFAEERFDHGTWCGFTLDGAHEALLCSACHSGDLARPLGPVTRRFPSASIANCDACHEDVHEGAFDTPGAPTQVAGRTDCARCHTTRSFDLETSGRGFDHALWTGYELEGAHRDVACASCHTEPRASGAMRLGRAPGQDCASCHADIHLGQFDDATGLTDCTRCHTVSAQPAFAAALFDHDRDCDFALDASHEDLDCSACHQSYPLDGGGSVVRYKPLGTACADCHGVVPK